MQNTSQTSSTNTTSACRTGMEKDTSGWTSTGITMATKCTCQCWSTFPKCLYDSSTRHHERHSINLTRTPSPCTEQHSNMRRKATCPNQHAKKKKPTSKKSSAHYCTMHDASTHQCLQHLDPSVNQKNVLAKINFSREVLTRSGYIINCI